MFENTAAGIRELWPIPTLSRILPDALDFNRRLAKLILEQEQHITSRGGSRTIAGLNKGLTTHWLEYNVLNWRFPEIAVLRKLVNESVQEYINQTLSGRPAEEIAAISCWANVLRFGEGLQVHHHDPAFVSAHYTVQAGYDSPPEEGDETGNTVYFRPGFLDRSHGDNEFSSPWDSDWRHSVRPTEGKLFLFPSFVRHEVRPYLGNAERISIALDVFLKSQNLPMRYYGPRWFIPK